MPGPPASPAALPLPPAPDLLAPLRLPPPVERIGGGYETDVFRSGDHRLALKLKLAAGPPAVMRARARRLARVSAMFCTYLGPEHSLPSAYLLVAGPLGQSHTLAVQPFLAGARPLDTVALTGLMPDARASIIGQLTTIVERSLACYRATGFLPDLYGTSPHDHEQARRWDPRWALRESWRIAMRSPLISAHNLLLTPDGQVVLVDYDPICIGPLSCRLAYGARALLLRRDRRQLAALARVQA